MADAGNQPGPSQLAHEDQDEKKKRKTNLLKRRIVVLERRNQELEELLERYRLLAPSVDVDSPASAYASTSTNTPNLSNTSVTTEQMRELACAMLRVDTQGEAPAYKPAEADKAPVEFNPQDDELAARLQHVHLTSFVDGVLGNRYLGKSSITDLILKLINLKVPATGRCDAPFTSSNARRPHFWTARPWESSLLVKEPAFYDFPDEDLMATLIDLYFDHIQILFPLLHRPSLEKGIRELQHMADPDFGAIVLLVCALGAQYSSDPRVLSHEYGMDNHSRGWKWFAQVEKARKPRFGAPNLLEIQTCCLSILFTIAGSNVVVQHIWTRIGVAVRYMQDVGAHRRRPRQHPTIVDELWIRAAWVLIVMDRHVSAIMGRRCALSDEDLAIRYPMDVDDEYWYIPEAPERSWKQPMGQPSKISYFIASIKLSRIIEVAMLTLYGGNKRSYRPDMLGEHWDRDVVQELDSALNKWLDDLPAHLRWDPEQSDHLLLNQAAHLHCAYRLTQIWIHRPFISADQSPAHSTLPSLTELNEIQLLMDYIKSMENFSVVSGRTWDMLNEFRSIGNAPESRLGKRVHDGTGEERNCDSRGLPDDHSWEAFSRREQWLSTSSMADESMPHSVIPALADDGTAADQFGYPAHPGDTRNGSIAIPPVHPGGIGIPGAMNLGFSQQSMVQVGGVALLFDPEAAPSTNQDMAYQATDDLSADEMAMWSSFPPAFDPVHWMALAGLADAGDGADHNQPHEEVDREGLLPYASFGAEVGDRYGGNPGYPT
ncbi:fungal-specific transcription factor domain-containing protein [Schizophyllum fasciatum]